MSPKVELNIPIVSNPGIQTYTAGEDEGRLAQMAQSFGLSQPRRPRRQVRERTGFSRVSFVFNDATLENARMRSIGIFPEEYDDSSDEDSPVISENRQRPKSTFDMLIAGGDKIDEESGSDDGDDSNTDKERESQKTSSSNVDPHAAGAGSTLSAAVFGIVKGMVGPAILYLPHALSEAGYAVGFPLLFLSTAMFLYSCDCLLKCWKSEMTKIVESKALMEQYSPAYGSCKSKRSKKISHKPMGLSYPSLAKLAFGEIGERLVMNGIALMQLGVCLTYFIFVPRNLEKSIEVLLGVSLPRWVYLALMVIVQIPLSWIKDIRKLTYTNVLANFLIMFGLVTCLYFALSNYATESSIKGPETVSPFSTLHAVGPNWFPFIGTAVFLFEGSITLCIPLQESVSGHQARSLYPSVNRQTIGSIILFYCFFGLTCWIAFGNHVETILTESLPADNILATTVQLAYCIAVVFTFPLQAYPAQEIIAHLNPPFSKPLNKKERNILTSSVVATLSIVALVEMDSLGPVVSIMGSLLGCPIAYIFPPLIYDRIGENLGRKERFLNWSVASFGVLGMIGSTYSTLTTWNTGGE